MLKIYNTWSSQKEVFEPIEPGKVSLYVCGITVYDYCHLGHARVFVAFDAIVRFLRATGWDVNYIRNITDIDDKIIARANEKQEPYSDLTERFIAAMVEDETKIGVERPNQEPKATDYIRHIIEMCQTLEEQGLAYVGDSGDLYFRVDKFPSYGQLSKRDLDQLQVGKRVEVERAKDNPLDFVLWKRSKAGEPSWPSPWGDGRPGWHIECSAMSTHCLGNNFDIHGGGHDLVFPHHENERAQSIGATNEDFANHWMHIGFVQVNKEKMSKSLNNFFTIRDILKEFSGEAIRYFLLSSHYRSPLNYSTDQLEAAQKSLTTLYTALRGIERSTVARDVLEQHPFYLRFVEMMNDDFNTPKALSVLFEIAHAINTKRSSEQDPSLEAEVLRHCAGVLGLVQQDIESFFQGESLDEQVSLLIDERNQARSDKNWARADEIRQQLSDMGIVLEDSGASTSWRRE